MDGRFDDLHYRNFVYFSASENWTKISNSENVAQSKTLIITHRLSIFKSYEFSQKFKAKIYASRIFLNKNIWSEYKETVKSWLIFKTKKNPCPLSLSYFGHLRNQMKLFWYLLVQPCSWDTLQQELSR
jgi:hypothetical protein